MKFVDTLSERRSSFLIGGMDSDIEELLRSAGASVLEPHRDDAPAEANAARIVEAVRAVEDDTEASR